MRAKSQSTLKKIGNELSFSCKMNKDRWQTESCLLILEWNFLCATIQPLLEWNGIIRLVVFKSNRQIGLDVVWLSVSKNEFRISMFQLAKLIVGNEEIIREFEKRNKSRWNFTRRRNNLTLILCSNHNPVHNLLSLWMFLLVNHWWWLCNNFPPKMWTASKVGKGRR